MRIRRCPARRSHVRGLCIPRAQRNASRRFLAHLPIVRPLPPSARNRAPGLSPETCHVMHYLRRFAESPSGEASEGAGRLLNAAPSSSQSDRVAEGLGGYVDSGRTMQMRLGSRVDLDGGIENAEGAGCYICGLTQMAGEVEARDTLGRNSCSCLSRLQLASYPKTSYSTLLKKAFYETIKEAGIATSSVAEADIDQLVSKVAESLTPRSGLAEMIQTLG
ncbi:hypothetical protein C8R46DRAFT_33037 [Mycena filopes]|nr:hypothetical protein C8R46DRAFT_33037 [Mycena filopes]